MPGHINDTTNIGFRHRITKVTQVCIALAAVLPGSQPALAKPGGEPLVLDTQTGIHSGVSGTVLQSGPLGGPGMVPMATLPGIPQEAQPPIVVSPYVEYSSGQNTVPVQPGGGVRPRTPRAPHP
ncbi:MULTISPECIES: hypothetical protein [Caballeronia]|jgi:hypothetical protein|uniref:Uncharacterized protein n=1 Tax=Caballeronia zhejiangensis TaxID=871203 RepID=A0A656QFG2_9BURK|nr:MULTISPECIES: hypothetical protein [Caballeronia]EKS67514.1 hypothetical protein BURK_020810 [Burkholderia sp. SJ98]KDR27477.1 hypothetical protein BG60_17575 [Caballeronia zhejiangensis]MCG7403594.1 hypothetical protein [Caballeronia zhejiangensis]MDR5765454.1 hypothetical protein [Caballeronia sp. LZ028]MDR5787070.1 hypothetical protein [Caballeronia sp. LP003]